MKMQRILHDLHGIHHLHFPTQRLLHPSSSLKHLLPLNPRKSLPGLQKPDEISARLVAAQTKTAPEEVIMQVRLKNEEGRRGSVTRLWRHAEFSDLRLRSSYLSTFLA
jgi:hypothetical protein